MQDKVCHNLQQANMWQHIDGRIAILAGFCDAEVIDTAACQVNSTNAITGKSGDGLDDSMNPSCARLRSWSNTERSVAYFRRRKDILSTQIYYCSSRRSLVTKMIAL